MFKRMAVLAVILTMTGACGLASPLGLRDDGPVGPPGSDQPVFVEGIVTTAARGEPIEGVLVELYYTESRARDFDEWWSGGATDGRIVVTSTRSDALGHYELSAGAPGMNSYRLRASRFGLRPHDGFISGGRHTRDFQMQTPFTSP